MYSKCCDAPQLPIEIESAYYTTNEYFRYEVCSNCYSLELSSEVTIEYGADYYSFNDQNKSRSNSKLQEIRYLGKSIIGRSLRLLFPLSVMNRVLFEELRKKQLSILDFGSGSGMLERFLDFLNYDSSVISYDPYYNGENTNVCCDINSIDFDKIDLIYANQVFEHLKDPLETLNFLYDKSKDCTELLVSIPIAGSLLDIEGVNAFTLQVPDHLNIYSLKGAFRLISKSYWQIRSVHTESLLNDYIHLSSSQKNYDVLRKNVFSKFKYKGDNNLVVLLTKNG